LLRVTPPQPRRIDFPPLRILRDLVAERDTPARTPPWLLILRLTLAALLILATAGPVWNPLAGGGRGPLLLVIDNGFPSAGDWRDRLAFAVARAEGATRDGRPLALVATADRASAIEAAAPAGVLERLRALKPQPHLVDRGAQTAAIERFLTDCPSCEAVWIADGTAGAGGREVDRLFTEALARAREGTTVVRAERSAALAIAGSDNGSGRMSVPIVRAEPNGRDSGSVRALDARGLPLADAPFVFPPGSTETTASFDLPMEVRNAISRVDISGEGSAGAVALIDERGRRRRIGLVSGASVDQAQPLLAPTYYISRALGPYADLREAPGGAADAISQLIDQQITMLVLADIGTLDRDTLAKVTAFVEKGGVLLRFGGTRLAAGNDELVPVRLRRGGRNLGGALSWDTPRTLAAFGRESPFFGLAIPPDLGVRRQILAEPDGDLTNRTWAALEDGTPIVTATRRGEGLIALVHVTADTTWSNLPLTGLFVDMLRRLTALSGVAAPSAADPAAGDAPSFAPTRVLDGFGAFVEAPANARAIPRGFAERAGPEHPPGFYGPAESGIAVNALLPGDRLATVDLGGLAGRVVPLSAAPSRDLRAPLLVLAAVLLLVDTLASLWLGGHLGRLRARVGRRPALAASLVGVVAALSCLVTLDGAGAQDSRASARDAALVTRLAFVVTGDAQVDATSRAGLTGLTQLLASRTAFEPGDPVGVDLASDELSFYPMLYMPVAAWSPSAERSGDPETRRLHEGRRHGRVRYARRDGLPAGRGGQPGSTGAPPHADDARHSRTRARAARSRADQDVLSRRALPRPLRDRPDLGRGSAPGG
jgi:hypothetical protein